MNINKVTTNILKNKTLLWGLEKISQHGTSFSAGTSLLLSLTLRPLAINSTFDVEKENKQYAMSNSICSGLMKFGIIEAVAIPIENAIKKIDNNPQKYLNPETVKSLSPRAYNLITQTMKLGAGLLTAIPKSMLTVALIPIVMDKIFGNKYSKDSKVTLKNKDFQGNFTGRLSNGISKIIDNKSVQNFAEKYKNYDKDIAKHITASTDVLLTSASALRIEKSKDIKENRKRALIYNNVISTAITLIGGYSVDSIIKNKTGKFLEKFKEVNAGNPKLSKYIEGINILRPALIFAGIYYGILPMLSTFLAEKIDKNINKI